MQTRCLARRLASAALLAGVLGCSTHSSAPLTATPTAYRSDVSNIQMVSTFVGANVYVPATVVLVGGREHTLSIFNATDQPHGFAIAGLGVETVLDAKKTTDVALPRLEGGNVYRIHCQLHAAHRTATLVVLPGE